MATDRYDEKLIYSLVVHVRCCYILDLMKGIHADMDFCMYPVCLFGISSQVGNYSY